MERIRWEGQNLQLGISVPGRRRRKSNPLHLQQVGRRDYTKKESKKERKKNKKGIRK